MNKPKLRVLHVLGELKPSGAETMLVAAADQFRAHGIEAEVLSIGKSTGPYAEQFKEAGYRIHHLPFSRSPSFFLRERKLMAAGQYDVIHLHGEGANFWHGLTALSTRPGVVLRTIHNAFAFRGNLQWRRGVQRRILHRLGVQHVAISASVQQTETMHYRLPTYLVWNWYNSRRFVGTSPNQQQAARQQLKIAEHDYVIASIGNCSPVKNHEAIIHALAKLPTAQRPIYLHAGLEQADCPEQILAKRLGVADRIRFLGGVKDVLPMLQAADLFVMPSLYEGFGIAAIEALATGLPAVFSDVAGLRDFRNDFPELIYCGTTADEVQVALLKAMQMDVAQRQRIAQDYPQIALRRFGMERGVAEYVALYRKHQSARNNTVSDVQGATS